MKPDYTEFNGDDVEAYIISNKVARRHLSKGQQAMAVALIRPEPQKKVAVGKRVN